MLRRSPGERVKTYSSRSPFGPLSVFSWIRYAKPQVLRKRARLPAAQKLAVVQPKPHQERERKSIMSSIVKRIFSFEFWLGIAAGVATRAVAKFAIHSALISAYGPNAEI